MKIGVHGIDGSNLYLKSCFLQELPFSPGPHFLSPLQIATRDTPGPFVRPAGTAAEEDRSLLLNDHRHSYRGVSVKDVATSLAYQTSI